MAAWIGLSWPRRGSDGRLVMEPLFAAVFCFSWIALGLTMRGFRT